MNDSCIPPYILGHASVLRETPIKPIRSLADDILLDRDKCMFEELKYMEERIKRHITECKREVIRHLLDYELKSNELCKINAATDIA